MAQSKLRKAIGAVKDQTSIGLAKVSSTKNSSLSALEVAIVKATRHQETPPEDRHISQILNLTAHSRALLTACVATIAKRLNKTKNWVVALKTLLLVQRLLSEGGQAHDQEVFSFRRRVGTRLLNMAEFRDASGGAQGWDYSAFVRTYAMYLDEHLEFRVGPRWRRGRDREEGDEEEGKEEEEGRGAATPDNGLHEMKIEGIFYRVHDLRQILERFLACRPTGEAKHNGIVAVALHPIVKESFQICEYMTEIIAVLIDRFMQLEVPDMVRVHEIFVRVSKQYDELHSFYAWCKDAGIVHDYPEIDKIPQKKLDMMDEFIHQKSALVRNRSVSSNLMPKPVEEEDTKALLPPLPQSQESVTETENKEEVKETIEENKSIQEVGDLLSFVDDNATTRTQEQENKLALVLFDNGPSPVDWETALFQSNSHLSNQKPSLGGGIDKITLDGMYQQGLMAQARPMGGYGRPAMLALPASQNGGAYNWSPNIDPFAASYAVPPQYVNVSEMERRQRLLVQEHMFWQQCGRNGMPGQLGVGNVPQQNPYHYITGGYTQTW